MGRNFKEKASYDYLHGVRVVGEKMLLRLRKKWNRHNYDWDEERERLVQTKDRISREEMKRELEEIEKK